MTRFGRPAHGTVVAYVALFFALSGTAVAAGGTLVLGGSNKALGTTTVSSTSGTPLSLRAPANRPPLAVSNTQKVGRLNADLLDGVDGGSLQRKTQHTCAPGTAVKSIDQYGRVGCTPLTATVASDAGLQARVTGSCGTGWAVSAIRADGTVACQEVRGSDPAPQPARHRDKGLAISDLQLEADEAGDWSAVARITNDTGETVSASLTVTALREGKIVGVLHGSVSDLEKGLTNTVELFSDDDHVTGEVTTSFQVDVLF